MSLRAQQEESLIEKSRCNGVDRANHQSYVEGRNAACHRPLYRVKHGGRYYLDLKIHNGQPTSVVEQPEGWKEQKLFALTPSYETLFRILPMLPIYGRRGFEDVERFTVDDLTDTQSIVSAYIKFYDLHDKLWIESEVMETMGNEAVIFYNQPWETLCEARRWLQQIKDVTAQIEALDPSINFTDLYTNRLYFFPLDHPLWAVQDSLRPKTCWVPGRSTPKMRRRVCGRRSSPDYTDSSSDSSLSDEEDSAFDVYQIRISNLTI